MDKYLLKSTKKRSILKTTLFSEHVLVALHILAFFVT